MNHYGKLAVVIFRVAACCVSLYGLFAVFYNVVYALLISNEQTPRGHFAVNVLASMNYLLIGIALYALSKPLASLITRKLKED